MPHAHYVNSDSTQLEDRGFKDPSWSLDAIFTLSDIRAFPYRERQARPAYLSPAH